MTQLEQDAADALRWYGRETMPGSAQTCGIVWNPKRRKWRASPLDTARWGVGTARVDVAEQDDIPDPREMVAHGVTLVIARVDAHRIDLVQRMEREGYKLCDTLVYWRGGLAIPHALQVAQCPFQTGYYARPGTDDDAQAVGLIAREAFKGYEGHYHADDRLPIQACDDAYEHWAQTACMDPDKVVELVAHESEVVRETADGPEATLVREPVAFGVITVHGDAVELELAGVREAHRGAGLYAHMVRKTMMRGWTLEDSHGITAVQISTQITNTAVQRVWARFGLKPHRAVYTMHWWQPS